MRRDRTSDRSTPGGSGTISVALIAGAAFLPIVVAVGFMTDPADRSAVPGDISVAALRGGLDGAPVGGLDRRLPPPARAGF